MRNMSEDRITEICAKLGYMSVKDFQREAINAYVKGLDVFVCAPTGSGKSLIYEVAALLLGKTVLIVQPLLALIDEQRTKFEDKGLNTVTISQLDAADECNYDFIFGTPEAFFESRHKLRSTKYHHHIGLIAVDESHCVHKL